MDSPTPARSPRTIVYVSSSMTHASDEYRRFVQAFKRELQEATSALVLQWVEKDLQVEFDDFFVRNLNNVKMCDAMIAIVDEPSIGVGMEIKAAIVHKKRFMCLHKDTATVSRLLMSAADSVGFPIKSYRTPREAVEIAAEFVTKQDQPVEG